MTVQSLFGLSHRKVSSVSNNRTSRSKYHRQVARLPNLRIKTESAEDDNPRLNKLLVLDCYANKTLIENTLKIENVIFDFQSVDFTDSLKQSQNRNRLRFLRREICNPWSKSSRSTKKHLPSPMARRAAFVNPVREKNAYDMFHSSAGCGIAALDCSMSVRTSAPLIDCLFQLHLPNRTPCSS